MCCKKRAATRARQAKAGSVAGYGEEVEGYRCKTTEKQGPASLSVTADTALQHSGQLYLWTLSDQGRGTWEASPGSKGPACACWDQEDAKQERQQSLTSLLQSSGFSSGPL